MLPVSPISLSASCGDEVDEAVLGEVVACSRCSTSSLPTTHYSMSHVVGKLFGFHFAQANVPQLVGKRFIVTGGCVSFHLDKGQGCG